MITIIGRTKSARNDRIMPLPVRRDLGEADSQSVASVMIKADRNRNTDSLTRVSKCMTSVPVARDYRWRSLPVEKHDMTFSSTQVTSHPGDIKKTIQRTVETNPDGKKEIKLIVDMHEFQPDEIRVRKDRNKLRVHAYHEEKDDNRVSCKMFQQSYCLPKNVRVTQLESAVDEAGTLTVKSSLKPQKNVTFAKEEKIGVIFKK